MPISGKLIRFTRENVDRSPDKPGVYSLHLDGDTIYIGKAEVSIRARLQDHLRGDEGRCTQKATHYRRELCEDPVARERELLQEYEDANGILPECNDLMP